MAACCGLQRQVSLGSFLVVLLAIAIADVSSGLTQLYCSSENTGSEYVGVDPYQSNGACFDDCKSKYAFAIVQYQECWCSNFIPPSTEPIDSCSQKCPGYPDERCGSLPQGLFGYIPLLNEPSGTGRASGSPTVSSTASNAAKTSEQVVSSESSGVPFSSLSPSILVSVAPVSTPSILAPGSFIPLHTSTSSSLLSPVTLLLTSFVQSSLPDPSPVTVEQTVTASPSIRISLVTLTPSTIVTSVTSVTSVSSATSPTSILTDPLSTTSADPVVTASPPNTNTIVVALSSQTSFWSATPFASVVTVTGQIKTITVTPTAPPEPTTPSQSSAASKGFAIPKIVGLAVGLASGFSFIAIMVLWWLFLRRKRRGHNALINRAGDQTPQRRPSRLSEMGLVSGTPQSIGDRRVSRIQTSGWGPSNNVEKSPSDANTPLDLRSSYPRVVDQRLDPVALWNPLHDNGSHISVRSFQDDQDYSRRMLRIANPDDY